jgi:hypothetical protein
MKGSGPLKLGGIAALYLLWLVNWLVLREVAFGLQNYSCAAVNCALCSAITTARACSSATWEHSTIALFHCASSRLLSLFRVILHKYIM